MGNGVAIMKLVLRYSMLLGVIALLSACTISHEFGPYKGKVVDAETGEPLEGAVVFIEFLTESIWNPGGPVSKFADAIEVITDSKGEFAIPSQKIKALRMLHRWNTYEPVIIFKPGYGAFPKHNGVGRSLPDEDHMLPETKYVVVKLPRLKSKKERWQNLDNTSVVGVPDDKKTHLLRLTSAEENESWVTELR